MVVNEDGPHESSDCASVAREKAVASAAIEVWFADEARIGQKNKLTRRWARRGTWPAAPTDQRTASSTHIFGAICPALAKGRHSSCHAAIPSNLAEIAQTIELGAHAVLLVDQAGWHLSHQLIIPAEHQHCAIAAEVSRAQPGRECLAVLAGQLAIEPHLPILHRRRRSLL
jgi:hypothetical protein